MSNHRAQPSSRNTRHGNLTSDSPPPDALHKYELIMEGTKFMVWNITFRMHISKAKTFDTAATAAAMNAIAGAFDLAYKEEYFIVNPRPIQSTLQINFHQQIPLRWRRIHYLPHSHKRGNQARDPVQDCFPLPHQMAPILPSKQTPWPLRQHQRNHQHGHLLWKTIQTPWNHHRGGHQNISPR